ncbi:ATP-dependent DNA helicase [Frankliniella fusca]|uniref:ATP-dependent DNA helicase n=1 Tax=Frankliniella fusca TaxID=407009 RepID=A0AAE1HL74_9NEOP|nr:ATP-dependent DNA helicase [Frankliniella fusca]
MEHVCKQVKIGNRLKCCVDGCGKLIGTVRLHKFPSYIEQCNKWMIFSGNADLCFDNVHQYRICSDHFNPSDFCNMKQIRLKKNAVPSKKCTKLEDKEEDDYTEGDQLGTGIGEVNIENDDVGCSSSVSNNIFEQDLISEENSRVENGFDKICEEIQERNKDFPNVSGICVIDMPRGHNTYQHFQNETDNATSVVLISSTVISNEDAEVYNVSYGLNDKSIPYNEALNIVKHDVTDNAQKGIDSERAFDDEIDIVSLINEAIKPKRAWQTCCVPSCENTNLNSSMFHLPKPIKIVHKEEVLNEDNLLRYIEWVSAIGNLRITEVDPMTGYKRYFICCDHFEGHHFKDSSSKKKRLQGNAVPSQIKNEPISEKVIENFKFMIETWKENIQGPMSMISDELCIESFLEDKLHWYTCQQCKEKRVIGKENATKCCHGKKCSNYTELNNMDPGEVPEELKELTFIEEQLIAQIHPIISYFKLKGLQYGYRGNVINFPQHVNEFAKELPHKIGQLAAVVNVRRKTQQDGYHDFRVRAMKVRNALEWLKINNPYYKNIIISEECLHSLPLDGNILSELNVEDHDEDANEITELNVEDHDDNEDETRDEMIDDEEIDCYDKIYYTGVTHTEFPQQEEQIKEYLNWPKLGDEPIDEFNTPGYIACAFPTLFPYGNADLRQERKHEVKTSNYFKHLMHYYDERFAKHTTFRFFAYNSWMRWTALNDGNVFLEKHNEYKNMTVDKLKELIGQNPSIMKQIMFHASNLRGTKAFWHTRANELRDMVEQLGLPTIFLTLSCADGHWNDLFKLLTKNNDVSCLTENDRRKLIQENPKVVDEFFDHRVQSFIKHVMKKKYKVKDYWYRVEYQHRGSPHIHGVFWFNEAPDVSNLDNASEEIIGNVINYFSELITAIDPYPNVEDSEVHPCRITYNAIANFEEDLAQLLHKVQRHTKCGPQSPCWKKGKCRFNFPKPLQQDASLQKEEGTDEWEFMPACNDSHLNKYNKFIIQLWRANMDIAPVISKKALIAYLTKYIAKCEVPSKVLEDTFSEVIKKLQEDDPAKKVLQKVFLRSCAERDISAQEVMHTLLGLKLYNAGGRKFVIVNFKKEEWIQVTENEEENNTRGKSTIEKYRERLIEHTHVTLYEAARKYDLPKWSKPEKENIVRVFPRYNTQDGEKFFRQQVLLHVPWRNELELLADHETWEEVYIQRNVNEIIISSNCDIGEINYDSDDADEINEGFQINKTNIEDEEAMIISQLGPVSSIPEVHLGRRQEDVEFDWHSIDVEYKQYGSIKELQTFVEKMKTAYKGKSKEFSAQRPQVTLSNEQAEVINLVLDQIKDIKLGTKNSPKSIIVQGKAGTGKSLLIKYVVSLLESEFGEKSYVLGAPTGAAAVLINGATIHSIFHLPKQSDKFKPLTGNVGKQFSEKFQNVKYIILDEFSMIGCSKLGMIDIRCKEATGNFEEPFGGLYIMLLGDIKQLPPVMDNAFYANNVKTNVAKHGMAVFKNINKIFILKTCFRQEADSFLQMLDKLSNGYFDEESYNLLSQRFLSNVSKQEIIQFEDAMRLFATKPEVKEYNMKRMKNLTDENGSFLPVIKISAIHNNRCAELGTSSDADGLEKEIYLAKGCKIMLKSNLWVEKGLVNGTIGIVHDILFDENTNPTNGMPAVIMCTFPTYTGPSLIPGTKVIPIRTIIATWTDDRNNKCTREQFPLVVAYACTIHKAQGMTLDKVVIDIGSKEFSPGLSYVALSRARKIDGLLLHPFLMKRLNNLRNPKKNTMQSRFTFIDEF